MTSAKADPRGVYTKDRKVMSSVSTAFKVHYNQKLRGPIRPSWGEYTMGG